MDQIPKCPFSNALKPTLLTKLNNSDLNFFQSYEENSIKKYFVMEEQSLPA